MFYVLLTELFIVHKFAGVPRVSLSPETPTGDIVLCVLHLGGVLSLRVVEMSAPTGFSFAEKRMPRRGLRFRLSHCSDEILHESKAGKEALA